MFTGIIETLGSIIEIEQEGSNINFTITSALSDVVSIDQSIAHNGVCLTVTAQSANTHTVTAIHETLQKTSLGNWQVGSMVNLERAVQLNARLDGHFVQGHVDTTAKVTKIIDRSGSWEVHFSYTPNDNILVPKGSICVDGTSLTLVDTDDKNGAFSVAIIPYTWQHTVFKTYTVGTEVNIEFDVLGKYLVRLMQPYADKFLAK